MVRWRYVLAALLLVPLVDATLLVFVAGEIGGVTTVLLVVLTGLLGMLLVRAEGRHTLRKLRRAVGRGEPPTDQLLDGAFLIAAGAFLLTPGLVTDVLGFLFALPPTRYPVREALKRYVVVPYLDEQTGGFATGNVYVGGFPGGGDREDGGLGGVGTDGGGPFGGSGDGGPFGGDGGPFDDADDERTDDDTVDVRDDEYSVK